MIFQDNKPLKGLVLAGGKSTRMQEDKGRMNWHGKEQRYYLADMLRQFCEEVFISCRKEQVTGISDEYKIITDRYDLGPLGAIVTALENDTACAWLMVACDLPLLDASTIRYLIENRKPDVIATTYQSPFDGLPEPLVTIWEAASLPVFRNYISEQKRCPRKILLNNTIHLVQPDNPIVLLNANTPADARKVMEILSSV
ncbi:MAG: NTP transferase domain-containing protein [Flavisolibacter sp.]